MVVYRLVKYEGTPEALEEQLSNSLPPGKHKPALVEITISTFDPDDNISIQLAEEHSVKLNVTKIGFY